MEHFTKPPHTQVDLYPALQTLVFKVSVDTLFGPKFLAAHGGAGAPVKRGVPPLQRAFFEFEACFELAASPVPHLFLPQFRRARAQLLAALRYASVLLPLCAAPYGRAVPCCPRLALSALLPAGGCGGGAAPGFIAGAGAMGCAMH